MAYFDVFWLCAVLGVLLVLLVFLMKRSVAEKGAYIAADSGEDAQARAAQPALDLRHFRPLVFPSRASGSVPPVKRRSTVLWRN
jgi:hypothetical protein